MEWVILVLLTALAIVGELFYGSDEYTLESDNDANDDSGFPDAG